jgi:hypothetical protein
MSDEIDKRIRLIVNAGDQAPVIKNQYKKLLYRTLDEPNKGCKVKLEVPCGVPFKMSTQIVPFLLTFG